MQTFLPSSSFRDSARYLDRQRLGRQRSECKIILRTLLGETHGWKNHPAVKMWKGHELALCQYAMTICTEWRGRGYKDSLLPYFIQMSIMVSRFNAYPPWLGHFDFHESHRSNLLRKDPEHYGQFWKAVPHDLPYVWPVR